MKLKRLGILIIAVALIGVIAFLIVRSNSALRSGDKPTATPSADLSAQSEEFKPRVIKVTDGVYVAVGYALANSILLEGKEGVIIVDTTESVQSATRIKNAFAQITTKPVKAIIYTHNHIDHWNGAVVFAGATHPDVYAHENTVSLIDRFITLTFSSEYYRAMRQFGTFLPPGAVSNAGIGPAYSLGDLSGGLVRPNKTFTGEHSSLELDGIKLEVYLAPGETPDQIFIWLPDKKVLLPADNYYSAFPNLYTIRGSTYRDVRLWVASLDKMRALKPEYLVPSHTLPLTGSDKNYETLTNYRDAIQFVHDQTIRGINQGLTVDEIVARVKLPAYLAQQPYLQEYYGTVEWSVRGIFDGNLGWFDGNATNLFELPLKERAQDFADLAGGQAKLLERAKEAMAKGNYQWAAELLDQLLVLDPASQEVRTLKSQALTALADKPLSANARNYYLTQALELSGKLKLDPPKSDKVILANIAMQSFFEAMPTRLDPAKSGDTRATVGFRFPDIGQSFTVRVRKSVAEVEPRFPDKPDIVVTANSLVWKEILAGAENPAAAFARGDVTVVGNLIDLVRFLSLFQ